MPSMDRALDTLGPLALALVTLAIIVGIGAVVLSELQSLDVISDTEEGNEQAENVVEAGLNALETFGEFFVVLVIVGIAAVIFLLLRVLKRANGRGR